MERQHPTKRAAILEAASRIVHRDGVSHLTIEGVAREAGVSKGGVLYHFPNKDALIEGMLNAFHEHFRARLNEELAKQDDTPGRWLRAFAQTSCNLSGYEPDFISGLIAALSNNPVLLESTRKEFLYYQQCAEQDGLPRAYATILRLAIDGLWFADLFHFASPEGAFRDEVRCLLQDMARPDFSLSQRRS
ncbi:TetR family transcriptional regulator [Thermosporothrix hazakensis]|jgi:AcrR family transcriptional regulator|uniref:TetR family transcriptional regulator n=2 Tax=Thermosporothrix TaxID=768650 RepID=A0A326U8U8_THEHA|nr:TetR/AcrR family transcriptional regulator [Thermosporothrix hazakensis]PZW22985.1 TetR family transcriptional regulator [Thermosporothrix hazakensis]BBH90076.1 TetR family transcriptional regulator [Thermosporothrix sp. COM3]GCE48297.1 TetR family transcriptional regulator [Thermosporothrix hazakensis]